MLRRLMLYLSTMGTLRRLITRYPFTRAFAWRFVAGQSADSALSAARQLREAGVMCTLDLLGESVTSPEDATRSTDQYVSLLDQINASDVESHVSLKLTQLGLDLSTDLCIQNLKRVLDRAREYGVFVRFDMESSAYTQRTLDIFYTLRPTYHNCGVVIQSYLYRSLRDTQDVIRAGGRVRLCKGAYLEPASVAYQRKEDVDANYIRLMELLLQEAEYPAIATHDPVMIEHAKRFTAHHNISPRQWEFQMLYGIRRDLQEKLAAEGYNVRCYVPFGTEWYPYFMRRLAERPANMMFLARNIVREKRRRGREGLG